MSADRDRLIDDLAQAILDGTPIDWSAIDSSAGGDRELIGELRLLSALADVHRSDPDEPAAESDQSSTTEDRTFPQLWGHLELLERIGVGTFGEVYRAWDTRLDREVAVKLMPAASSDDPQVASIIREGRLLAKVRHPGVVTIYDAQQIGDSVGLWMEFIRGRTLEQRLQEDGRCDASEAIDIGMELCRSVKAVHDAGLLHRDIKPQNVVRASDGRLVLMDFGIGRELADGSISDLAGTPLYLAPEIFRGAHATVRTDVYSIGVLLYHLLTGTYPVAGDDRVGSPPGARTRRHAAHPIRPPRSSGQSCRGCRSRGGPGTGTALWKRCGARARSGGAAATIARHAETAGRRRRDPADQRRDLQHQPRVVYQNSQLGGRA